MAALCVATITSGIISASAAAPVGEDKFTDGDYTFQRVKVTFVYGVAMPGLSYEDHYYETFSDGFLLICDQDNNPCYLGEDGTVHDLNRGRFEVMHPFSEGLAAVIDNSGKVGYIDTSGKLVIPCQFDAPINQITSPCASLFKDGKAWVFRASADSSAMEACGGWAQIDTAGKLLTDYSPDAPVGEYWMISSENVEKYNLFCLADANYATGKKEQFPDVCTAPKIGTFTARFGGTDTGLASIPNGGLYIVKRKTVGTRNLSTYTTTSFETVNPTGSWDAIASYHQVNYKLENTTAGIDNVDIVVIPCVRGEDFDFDGSQHLSLDSYYPLTVERIGRTLQPGEVVRGSFRPQWGFESYLLKYVVIKLEPGDMELLQQNCIGVLDNDMTYHPSRRTVAGNQLASDFVHKYFAEYLK